MYEKRQDVDDEGEEDEVFHQIIVWIRDWGARQPARLLAYVEEKARERGCECHECVADSLGEHTCSIFKVPRDDPASQTEH